MVKKSKAKIENGRVLRKSARPKKIDEEVRSLVNESYTRAKDILTKNRDKLDKLSAALVEKEVIDIDESRILLDMAIESTPQTQEKPASDQADPPSQKS